MIHPQEVGLIWDNTRMNEWIIAFVWLKENSSHCKMVAEQVFEFAAAAAAAAAMKA